MTFLKRSREMSLALSLIGHVLFLVSWWSIQPERHETPVYTLSYGEAHLSGPSGEAGKPKASKPRPRRASPSLNQQTATTTQASADTQVQGESSGPLSGSAGSGEGHGGGHGQSLSLRAYYSSQISRILEQNKRYPRSARMLRQEGEVVVALKIAKTGKLLDVKLESGSRYPSLNEASLETVKSVDHFPPIPEELGVEEMSFQVPMRFSVKM